MKSVILEDSKCLHDFYIVPACYFERLAVKMWNCDREEPHSVICEQVFFPSWFCKKKTGEGIRAGYYFPLEDMPLLCFVSVK